MMRGQRAGHRETRLSEDVFLWGLGFSRGHRKDIWATGGAPVQVGLSLAPVGDAHALHSLPVVALRGGFRGQ